MRLEYFSCFTLLVLYQVNIELRTQITLPWSGYVSGTSFLHRVPGYRSLTIQVLEGQVTRVTLCPLCVCVEGVTSSDRIFPFLRKLLTRSMNWRHSQKGRHSSYYYQKWRIFTSLLVYTIIHISRISKRIVYHSGVICEKNKKSRMEQVRVRPPISVYQ